MDTAPLTRRGATLLFFVGCNLSLLQVFLLREFSALFYGTELMIVLLLSSYFFGQALGFAAYRQLTGRFAALSFLWAALPLAALPVVRLVCGWGKGKDQQLGPLLLVFILLCSFSAVYSAILPQVVECRSKTVAMFATSYSAELAGALCGLALMVMLGGWRWLAVELFYPLVLLLLLFHSGRSRALQASVLVLLAVSGLLYRHWDHCTAERFYQLSDVHLRTAQLCFREDSAYQKVDVLRRGEELHLYLNGVEYFSPGALDHFNFYLSELPARALQPEKVLVIGSGSMSSAGRLSEIVREVTNVELDPAVVKASKLFFTRHHPPVGFPWRVVFADGREFLRHTPDKFDLIILDVPTSFTLQTGSLFTEDFFSLARARLTPNGAMSIYLSEQVRLGGEHRVAGPILSAFTRTFQHVSLVVADDAVNSFALGSNGRPDLKGRIDETLSQAGRFRQTLYDTGEVRREAARWKPATLRNLRHVWAHQ